MAVSYAELHAHSAFSFLDGASLPEELAAEAARLGLAALALTDHDGLQGVVAFARAVQEKGLSLGTVFGSELNLGTTGRAGAHEGPGGVPGLEGRPDPDGTHLLVLARDPEGYARLSHAIGRGKLEAGVRGRSTLTLEEAAAHAGGRWLILTGCRKGHVRRALGEPENAAGERAARRELDRLTALFGRENVAVEVTDTGAPLDAARNEVLAALAEEAGLPLVATGAVHCAKPTDRLLAHTLAAIRARATLDELDGWLPAAPAHLRDAEEMLARHPRRAVEAAAALGRECAFDLRLIKPNLPPCPVPEGYDEASWLRELTERGAVDRYGPRGAPEAQKAYDQIDHELRIIIERGFPGYFLIVHEIVDFCRGRGILCQGRGSAANSAVCYALGITAVDAVRHGLLFERFLSPERSEEPDIDLDIEAGRREEVIQHVYERYGRTQAAQVANVISYRPRSAVRDVARALGHDPGQQEGWARSIERWGPLPGESSGAAGEPGGAVPKAGGPVAPDLGEIPTEVLQLAQRLQRLPRHLSIHSGGMVLCDRPVIDVCPVEWATMPGRTVLQWDKDDCASAGLVKFDLLGLGMLTALRLAFDAVNARLGPGEQELALHALPEEDERVYELLRAADTVGVFQVESRAQMATLPRLQPKNFYDLVVEVALIRPGPIQGDSVNPYLERRQRLREDENAEIPYLHEKVKPVLERTLGVPLFQEQLMQLAVDLADFTPAEADRLRKAMGAKDTERRMGPMRERLLAGMAANGVPPDVAEKIYGTFQGFADFGFPESHAFSFAHLVYASAWLKVHHPEAFYAALLAAQPMGFYSPQSLVADARRHGVTVLRADVNASQELACMQDRPGEDPEAVPPEPAPAVARLVDPHPGLMVRLGLAAVRGVGEKAAERIVAERERGGPYADLADLARRVELSAAQLEALATAGALRCFGLSRREALWASGALAGEHGRTRRTGEGTWVQQPLPLTAVGAEAPGLPEMTAEETAVADVWATGVSPTSFPTQFRREELRAGGVLTVAELIDRASGEELRVGGVVTHRQRPATAAGVTFLSLEDETGLLNVVCTDAVWDRHRVAARAAAALVVTGRLEKAGGVVNLLAHRLDALPLPVPSRSRDFQ